MLPSQLLEQGWCQTHGAMDQNGNATYMGAPEAVRWCFVGAPAQIFGMDDIVTTEFWRTGQEILEGLGEITSMPQWNDNPNRTQAEVVALAKLVEIKMGLRVEGEDWAEEEPLEVGEVELVEGELCLV